MRSMKKRRGGRRGTGSLACHDGTLAVGLGCICRAKPSIVLRSDCKSGSNRIVFNIIRDFLEFALVSNPVIVGFSLPKRLTGAAQEQVCLPRGGPFHPAEQAPRRYFRQQEDMDVVGHDHPCPQVIVAELDAPVQRVHNNARDIFPSQMHWAKSGCIQVTIHPHERLPGSQSRRRVEVGRKAVVQVPGDEEPFAFGVDVGKAAMGFGHRRESRSPGKFLLSEFATAGVPSRQAGVPAPRVLYA